MARRPARLVRRAWLALACAGLVVVGGCGAVTELIRLQQRIEDAGYRVESVFHEDFGRSANEVQIEARSGSRGQEPPAGQEDIAEIVWTTYPRRFDVVRVELDNDITVFSRAELQERFGVRDASLDARDFGDDIEGGVRAVAWYGLVVLVAGAIAIVTTLVRLHGRRTAYPSGSVGGWGGGGSYPGAGSGAGPGWPDQSGSTGGTPAWSPGAPPPPPSGPPPGWSPPGPGSGDAGAEDAGSSGGASGYPPPPPPPSPPTSPPPPQP